MSPHARKSHRSRRRRGSILLDSLIGLTLLAMGAASFYSFLPVVAKSHQISDSEQKANQIVTKMLEHIQLLSPSKLTATNLTGMQLIDPGQTEAPFKFNNIPLDDSTRFSPSKALKNGTGTLSIANISDGSVRVIVTVAWKSPSGKSRSTSSGTILGAYRS